MTRSKIPSSKLFLSLSLFSSFFPSSSLLHFPHPHPHSFSSYPHPSIHSFTHLSFLMRILVYCLILNTPEQTGEQNKNRNEMTRSVISKVKVEKGESDGERATMSGLFLLSLSSDLSLSLSISLLKVMLLLQFRIVHLLFI